MKLNSMLGLIRKPGRRIGFRKLDQKKDCVIEGQSSHGNRVLLKREVRLSRRVGSSRIRIFVSSLFPLRYNQEALTEVPYLSRRRCPIGSKKTRNGRHRQYSFESSGSIALLGIGLSQSPLHRQIRGQNLNHDSSRNRHKKESPQIYHRPTKDQRHSTGEERSCSNE